MLHGHVFVMLLTGYRSTILGSQNLTTCQRGFHFGRLSQDTTIVYYDPSRDDQPSTLSRYLYSYGFQAVSVHRNLINYDAPPPPKARGIAGTLTFGPVKTAKSPTLRGLLVGKSFVKPLLVSPTACYLFISLPFLARLT